MQAMRVVNEAIEDGIRNGRIGDDFMPVFDGQLTSDQRGAAIMPIIDNLQEIVTLIWSKWGESPIVKNQ